MRVQGELWAIIYGADEDQHTHLNDASVFRETLARVANVVAKKRIVVAMTSDVHADWGEALSPLPYENRIETPYERGTPAAALLAFFQIFRREPTSRVLLIPANHRVQRERVLLDALKHAAENTPGDDNCAVLIGMREKDPTTPGDLIFAPDAGATRLGPTDRASTHKVVRIESTKEADKRARAVECGALISSGILAAGSSALLRIYDHTLPGMLRSFLANLRGQSVWSAETLARLFRFLPRKQLSHDLLQPAIELLRVLPVDSCGYQNLEYGDRLAHKLLYAEPNATLPVLGGRRPALELLPS